MLRRLFVGRDGRMAIGWRMVVAFVLWFILLVVTEQIIAGVLSAWVGGVAVIALTVPLVSFFRRAFDRRTFAAMRLADPVRGLGHLVLGFLLGAAGIWLGLLRLGTGTLWLAIGAHAGWDFIESGVVGSRLLPANGPVTTLEATVPGVLAVLVLMAVTLAVVGRRRVWTWTSRMDEVGNPWKLHGPRPRRETSSTIDQAWSRPA